MRKTETQPANKLALLTTLTSSLMSESPAEHHTAEKYSKNSRVKLRNISEGAIDYEILARIFSWYKTFELKKYKLSKYVS